MMIKRFVFLWMLLFIVAGVVPAQNITVKGVAEGRPFEKITLFVFDDDFSGVEKKVAETMTDEQGVFSVDFALEKTKYAFLKVGLKKGEFYLKPGAHYEVTIFKDTARQGSVFDKPPLSFRLQAEDGGLNKAVGTFNSWYNTLLLNDFKRIYQYRDKKVVADFKNRVASSFDTVNDAYFKIYVRYTLGQLEWASKIKSANTILKEYFVGNPIDYDNIQYADFFKEFFKEYVNRRFYNKYFNELRSLVYAGDAQRLDDILKTDTVLAGADELREMVLINAAFYFFYDKNFSGAGVLKLLEQVKATSKYQRHREIAGNYILKLTHLMPGTPAPDFKLPQANGKLYGLESVKGSFVVLDFLKADCPLCLAHLDFLKDIDSKLGVDVKIVLLVYGKHPEKVRQLLEQKNIDWPVLYVGKRTDVLDAYDVAVFPTYIILKPDGTIGMAPAAMADENLENDLVRMIYQWKRKNNGK